MDILILTTIRAPYRVELFNEIGKNCNLTVCFEQEHDSVRDVNWYDDDIQHFKSIMLKNANCSLKKIKSDFISVLKNKSWDICIFYEFSTNTAMVAMMFCILHNIKYVINCDGAIERKNTLKDIAKNIFIKNSTACLANGKSAFQYFRTHKAKENNIYMHCFGTLHQNELLKKPLNEEEKNELRVNLGLPLNKTLVIAVGAFIERKGFEYILDSFNSIKDKDIMLLLIGGGPKRNEYETFIKENNLRNVILKDFIKKPELYQYFKASDIFVFPTLYDIWGLVVVEAMSFGLSVISTNNANSAIELIKNDENGYICNLNSKEFEKKILYLHYNPKVRYDFTIKNLKIASNYTIENNAKMHLENLKEILNK